MKIKKIKFWQYGIIVTVIISALLGYNLFKGDQSLFLSGQATHGHHQIELECQSCHTETFADQDIIQKACEGCHLDELESVSDSHPKKKFMDPRNAVLLERIDARYCVSCHTEHKPDLTRKMGVTVAKDFCFHCHQEIAEDRPSHAEFAFDSCASSGCHNFHDNSMLYEDFLIRHINEPMLKKKHLQPIRTSLARWLKKNPETQPLTKEEHDGTEIKNVADDIIDEWSQSAHAQVAVNCSDCHNQLKLDSAIHQLETCGNCHEKQTEQFQLGKHGMRAPLGLPTVSTEQARVDINPKKSELLSCTSCHNPHKPDLEKAAVESCLECHQDQHSVAYQLSPHHRMWQKELAEKSPQGSGVTCASCHLPRIKKGKRVEVMHNQNHNLRPNSKMLKKVCMNCHGLEFSLNALADEELIKNNFNRAPNLDLKTFELIQKRIEKRKQKRNQ